MRLIKQIIIVSLLLFVITNRVCSQSCRKFNYHYNCGTLDLLKDYKQYGQARGRLLTVNETTKFQVVFYGNKDYKLIFCVKDKYYPIHFRFIDAETKKCLYDNKIDDYIESVGFTVENNLKMIIEVTVLANRIKPEDAIDLNVCAGVQIIWRRVPIMGF